jgi:uncharacterized protein (TIGR02453 family)
MAFTGFTETSISFLKDLARNNDKKWFEQNRSVYEEFLLIPMKQLVTDLGATLKGVDDKIDITPGINKTVSKIFRDIRFSHDKSPLRTDQWILFKRPVRIWGNVPEFYMYFTSEEYQYGMGYYAPSPTNMENFRHKIDMHPEKFERIIKQFDSQKSYVLYGENYKKQFQNLHPEKFQQWYQKKNFYVSKVRKMDKSFFSPKLKDEIESAFLFNAYLYNYLIESIID